MQNSTVQTGTHAAFGDVRYSIRDIGPFPDHQVAQTIGVMRSRVREDARQPWFQSRAQRILGAGDELAQVHAAHQHARGGIRFVQDEHNAAGISGLDTNQVVEVIVRPADMARYCDAGVAQGDCDDFSMYVAALLESQGIPCAFATVGADARGPDQYSHVYCVAYPRNAWGERIRVPVDASHGEYCGWEVPNRFGKYREWPVSAFGSEFLASILGSIAAIWLYGWLKREVFA